MIRARLFALIALAAPWMAAGPARAQGTPTDSNSYYTLAGPPSEFEWGCFGPCMCPVIARSPLTGSFWLRLSSVDPLYTHYDVLDVQWKAPGDTQAVTITGSGTYRRGGEAALMEELALDLTFDGRPPRHFDSGLKPVKAPFPEIDTRVSLHDQYCFDSVLVVDAKPLDPASVVGGLGVASLAAAPNPFVATTEIVFAVSRPGVIELDVFDLAGRRVRTLAEHEWLASGSHRRAWDGHVEGGRAAPPGLYLIRLDEPSGRSTRALVKLR